MQRTPLPSGIRLRFAPTAERMRQIDAVVRREHECCPFLEFRVGLALGDRSLTLDVTGPDGTATLLAELLAPAARRVARAPRILARMRRASSDHLAARDRHPERAPRVRRIALSHRHMRSSR